MNKLFFLSLFFLISFNSMNAMKSILKKPDGKEKKDKVRKRVHFKDSLVTRRGDGWLPELTLKFYCGFSPKAMKKKGFEADFIKKALKNCFEVEAPFKFLLQFPNTPCQELVNYDFSKQSASAAKMLLHEVYVHTKHCLIANQNPRKLEKEGVPKKIVQKVSDLVARVKKIWATSRTSGQPQIAVIIAEQLGCLRGRRKVGHIVGKQRYVPVESPNQEEQSLCGGLFSSSWRCLLALLKGFCLGGSPSDYLISFPK